MTSDEGVYYDPYDFEIDNDPYPVWRRLREEAPLYHNEKHDFYALSRFDDVEQRADRLEDVQLRQGHAARDHQGRHRVRGRAPAGQHPVRGPADPRRPSRDPLAGVHARSGCWRSSRRFASSARRRLDPLVGSAGFDFITDLGAQMPMRTIGMLLGIPESDQEAIRQAIDESLALEDGDVPKEPIDAVDVRRGGCSASTSTGAPRIRPTTS